MSETCCATECPTCGHVEGELLEVRLEEVRWEYKTSLVSGYTIRTSARIDPALNAQGRDGWELVQLIPTELEGEGYHRAIFKRRRRTEPNQGKCCECGG